MSRHAYVDESIRGRDYMICVTRIPSSETKTARRKLRALTSPGQRRIHFSSESDQRRRVLLKKMAALETGSVIYVAQHPDQVAARAAILAATVPDLVNAKVTRLVLESRQGQDHRDRSIISRMIDTRVSHPFAYTHSTPSNEPLLWVPDAVAWAWGRDRRWRKLVDDLQLVTEEKNIKMR